MKVSCIIPAYNEASRVSDVIDVLLTHPLIGEIIVINDGSTDDTKAVLEKKNGITLYNLGENQGKTNAVLHGMERAAHEVVMLIDADLIGLTHAAITDLVAPVLDGRADITMSLRKNALIIYKLLGIDFVSGERVFDKHILLAHKEHLHALPGFGLEVYTNDLIINRNMRLKIVLWPTVISPRKGSKIGFFLGNIADAKMLWQILSTVSIVRCTYQVYQLKRLSRN